MSTALKEQAPQPIPTVTAPEPKVLSASELFINREASLLEFHRRVLEEALDKSNPLLERLKFLSIFSSNLDEFFMIRVSGLKEEQEENFTQLSLDGMTPGEQLQMVRERVVPMIAQQQRCLTEEILPKLKAEGIEVVSYQSLPASERQALDTYYFGAVFPVLTPLAVDPTHPFPYISPLSLNIGLVVQAPHEPSSADPPKFKNEPRFVRIKVPSVVSRLVPVGMEDRFVLVEDLIKANISSLFPGMDPGPSYCFRVTRDADIEIREEEAEDLLRVLQREIRQRRFGSPVRLEVSADCRRLITTNRIAGFESDDVYPIADRWQSGFNALYEMIDLTKDNPFSRGAGTTRPAVRIASSRAHFWSTIPRSRRVTDFINERWSILTCSHHDGLYRTGPIRRFSGAESRQQKGKRYSIDRLRRVLTSTQHRVGH